MITKFKSWIRRLLFNLLREDIEALINKPKELEWVAPLIEKPKSDKVISYIPHKSLPGKLLVTYEHPYGKMVECVGAPSEEDLRGKSMEEYLLALPHAHL